MGRSDSNFGSREELGTKVNTGRRHIIVLPYWCQKEVDNFLQVLRRWDVLCKTQTQYSFLLAKRFDIEQNLELESACSSLAPTTSISCDSRNWTGWPAGANGMFLHVMEHIAQTENKDGGFVFWFEHDVIPIYADWLDWLDKTWESDAMIVGQYMSPAWISLHQLNMPPNINGTACYNKSLAYNPGFKQINSVDPFDFTLSLELPKYKAKCVALPLLFDLWFFMPDWVKRCDLTKLMINGIKFIDQREQIIEYILTNRDE